MSEGDATPGCSYLVSGSLCALRSSTGCNVPGNRIRVLQHGHFRTNLNTDWTPSKKRVATLPSFLDLPREIRDTIYEHILPTDQDVGLGTLHVDFEQKTSHVHPRSTHVTPANWTYLLRVSKQLHHEVAAQFYSANTFSISCQVALPKLDDFATRALSAVGFAGLTPLHPAYMRFLRGIEIRSTFDTWRDVHTLFDPIPSATIPTPSKDDAITVKHPTMADEDAIRTFIQTTQSAIDARTACHCPRLIPLGNGTYTLRRPPGPARERCKSRTWKCTLDTHGEQIAQMKRGEFPGLNRRGRPPPYPAFLAPAWEVYLWTAVACLTCCLPLCVVEVKDRMRKRRRGLR